MNTVHHVVFLSHDFLCFYIFCSSFLFYLISDESSSCSARLFSVYSAVQFPAFACLSKHFVNLAFKIYSITKVSLLFHHCPLSTFGHIPRKAANPHIWDAATGELHKTMMACQNSWHHICVRTTIKCGTYCFSAAWHLASGHCYIVTSPSWISVRYS